MNTYLKSNLFYLLTGICFAFSVGCEKNELQSSNSGSEQEDRAAREHAEMIKRIGEATETYWNNCINVNNSFISSKSEIWF